MRIVSTGRPARSAHVLRLPRVFKGMRMAGRMGGDRKTSMNLEIVEIDVDRGLLLVRGAVPGGKGAVVLVREAVKADG